MQIERMCISCRSVYKINQLWRFVLELDGIVDFDLFLNLDGRGAYVCKKKECLQQAIYKKSFTRAFKKQILGIRVSSGENTHT